MVYAIHLDEALTALAERRLHELARDLCRVPLAEGTWRYHVRMLVLKRIVASWRETSPDALARSALLESLHVLAREVRQYRPGPALAKTAIFRHRVTASGSAGR